MSYADDLKHPLWQRCRLRVFERASFHCQRCASDDQQLHAHHKIYLRGRKPWEYPEHLLECLCDACHTRAHAERDHLDLLIAQHPTALVPSMTKIVRTLAVALEAGDYDARVHAMNALNDELDVIQDLQRGSCEAAVPA